MSSPALSVARFGGLIIFALGILSFAMISPMIVGLHEPVMTCWPFVSGRSGRVAQ